MSKAIGIGSAEMLLIWQLERFGKSRKNSRRYALQALTVLGNAINWFFQKKLSDGL